MMQRIYSRSEINLKADYDNILDTHIKSLHREDSTRKELYCYRTHIIFLANNIMFVITIIYSI